MRIFLTGSSGFLGKALLAQFKDNELFTVSRKSVNNPIDLSYSVPDVPPCDLVIHAAGKAHSVPRTKAQREEFLQVNVSGTQNLLKGLEKLDTLPTSFVFISSVAVYGLDIGEMINEDSDLKAKDAYAISKIRAELIISDWCSKHNVICTILRLPLLAGVNPPGNLKAMIKAICKGYYFDIADGKAQKSIVMDEDVAKIIRTAHKIGGVFNLTDGINPTVSQLSALIARQHKKAKPMNMPYPIAKIVSILGDLMGDKAPINSKKLKKITSNLTFDDTKAQKILGWKPQSVLEKFKSI